MAYTPSFVNPRKRVIWQGFNPFNQWGNYCSAKSLEEDYMMKSDARVPSVDENNPKFMPNIGSSASSSSPMASDFVNINQNGDVLAWNSYNNLKVKSDDLITRGVEGCSIKDEVVFNNEYNNNIYNSQPLMNAGIMPQPTTPDMLPFQMVESTAVPMLGQKWGGFMECLSGVSGPTFVSQPPLNANGYMDNMGYVENRMSQTLPMNDAKAVVDAADKKLMEKTMERRQKRMIKNRESAARSRARKQAHTDQLERTVAELTKMNERLRKENELMRTQPSPRPCLNCKQHRRTSSAQF